MAEDKVESLYLSEIRVSGYKSIENLTIKFNKNLNIIIGKNGVGKSIFFELINDALESYLTPHELMFKSIRYNLTSTSSDKSLEIEFTREHSKLEQGNAKVTTVKSQIGLYNKSVFEPESKLDEGGLRTLLSSKNNIPNNDEWRSLEKLNFSFSPPLLLKHNTPKHLPFIDNPGTITVQDFEFFDEWQYPGTLNFLKSILENAERLWNTTYPSKPTIDHIKSALTIDEAIISALQKFTPIKNIRFNPNINLYDDLKDKVIDNVRLEFYLNNRWHPWSQLSDGTKRLFYLVTEIVSKKEGVILVEEPELGVHPHQLHLLMNFIKEESANKQIILSTHAPQVLNHLELDELDKIILASYDIGSGTKMRHLNEEEREKAKEYMQEVGYLSDYWLHSDLES